MRPILLLGLLLFLSACSGDDPPPSTPTPPDTPTRPVPSATSQPPTTATPEARQVPLTVLLADAETGDAAMLIEDFDFGGWLDVFDSEGDSAYLLNLSADGREGIRFSLDGVELERDVPEALCTEEDRQQEVRGGTFEAWICQPRPPTTSPDGEWSLVQEGSQDSLEYDLWAENNRTGERFLLQAGLFHCGGCDGRWAERWSPSSRFIAFSETGAEGRAYLGDLVNQTARLLYPGNQVGDAPQWSPRADVLLYPSTSGAVKREDVQTGASVEFGHLAWPARFDTTGLYLYTPAFVQFAPEKEPDQIAETTVARADDGSIVAVLGGAPAREQLFRFRSTEIVTAVNGGFVAALQHAAECDGTTVYIDETEQACLEDAQGASISPDGRKVAFARVTGQTGLIEYPGGGSVSQPTYDVAIFDIASGTEMVVATDTVSGIAPDMIWNAASSHLLIRWPVFAGL